MIPFLIILVSLYLFIPCFPTPASWWQWRIRKKGDGFYPQAIGFLKPWWHCISDECGAVGFKSEELCQEFIRNYQKDY